ncbi:MAG: hypothetical protein K9N46_15415 [Candidatus Marinimicrobia bacterium]|nr:hypothetical protein [Candidatus Neomarinimicrobiota bacterium]MCF7830071.1 hypothetical protein [Candidatus Neomarinimicrobiota bacterium]MCF7882118.1 hypothetical protein [Candidatus Neomarinimicrobiota bacterium]
MNDLDSHIRIHHLLIVFYLCLLTMPLMGQDYITNYSAEYSAQENGIVIAWETGNEDGVKQFQVERSVNNSSFDVVDDGVVLAKGEPSYYEIIDTSDMFQKPDGGSFLSGRVYTYRIRIVFTDKTSSITENIQVSPKISSTHHTWGTIKAMFK